VPSFHSVGNIYTWLTQVFPSQGGGGRGGEREGGREKGDTVKHQSTDLVLSFIQVIDSPQGEDIRGIVVPQFAQNDAIPQCLLQLCGRGELLLNT